MDIQNANAVPRLGMAKNTRALLLFSDSIDAHIAALHAACRDLLAQKDANGAPTREVRIEIRSSLDPAAPSEYSSPTTDRSNAGTTPIPAVKAQTAMCTAASGSA